MSKARLTTIVIAIILGAGGAWLSLPILSRHRALNAITHYDESERRAGWTWLLDRDSQGLPRAAHMMDRVNKALSDANAEPLLNGAAALRECGLWGWDHQKRGMIVREMGLRALTGDAIAVAGQLLDAPLDLDEALLLPLVNTLLQSQHESARQTAFFAACGWAGPARAAWLARLSLRPDDTSLRRALQLAATWCDPALGAPIDADAPTDVLEAMLLRRVRSDPNDAGPIIAMATDPGKPPPAVLPDVLRYSRDREALHLLRRLAKEGNRGAEFALQTRSPNRDEQQARLVLAGADQPIEVRRLAAWRWDGVDLDQVRALLASNVSDTDGSVYATALLAERRLPRPEAVQQAETWIRSFNDDEKRAGALLAALLNVHGELLREALDLENMPRVRTTHRLALAALGIAIGSEDLDEFGYRVLHLADGGLNPDTLLCLLAAGRTDALRYLTRRPQGDASTLGRGVQKQAWLIERFVPRWHAKAGRPIGSSLRGLRLYFDDLEAARMLTSRRIEFDRERRVFVP